MATPAPTPVAAPPPLITPPPIIQLRHTEKFVPSSNPDYPYKLEITIQTNVVIEEFSAAILVKGGEIDPDPDALSYAPSTRGMTAVSYHSAVTRTPDSAVNNVALIDMVSPPFTPEANLIVDILSKSPISVVKIVQTKW